MNFPKINEYKCPDDTVCPDSRCDDPVFAAGNPILCGGVVTLILKPETSLLCKDTGATQTFKTYARSANGEVQITAGVVYSSSTPGVLSINASTGVATAVAAGIATVTATVASFGQSAYAQVTVITDGCCEDVCVNTVLLWDVSGSMHSANKGSRAGYIVKHMILDTLNNGKDYMSVVAFHEAIVVSREWSNSPTLYASPPWPHLWYDGTQTDIPGGLEEALGKFNDLPACELSSRQQVIVVISDGNNVVALSEAEVAELLEQCQGFKSTGGIIVVVGINANGEGYSLLQAMASGGFFINDHGTGAEAASAIALLQGIVSYYCGCGSPTYPAYGCAGAVTPGEQTPDEDAPEDVEPGA